jgi:hypothetical protein
MKELNYSASSPVELPIDAASEQARVATTRRKLSAAKKLGPRREYRSNKKSTQQLFRHADCANAMMRHEESSRVHEIGSCFHGPSRSPARQRGSEKTALLHWVSVTHQSLRATSPLWLTTNRDHNFVVRVMT